MAGLSVPDPTTSLLQLWVSAWRGTRGTFLDLRVSLLSEDSQTETEHVIAEPRWDLPSSNWSVSA